MDGYKKREFIPLVKPHQAQDTTIETGFNNQHKLKCSNTNNGKCGGCDNVQCNGNESCCKESAAENGCGCDRDCSCDNDIDVDIDSDGDKGEYDGYKKVTSFSIMTYNILNQKNIHRHMFPYASSKALKLKHRKKRLIGELKHWNSDIVALQELNWELLHGDGEFQNSLLLSPPSRTGRGGGGECGSSAGSMSGVYGWEYLKSEYKSHGVGILYKRKKFRVAKVERINLNIPQQDIEEMNSLTHKDEEYHTDNVALIVVLELIKDGTKKEITMETKQKELEHELENKKRAGVIVATTHLFWRPEAAYIRLHQTMKIMNRLKALQSEGEEGDWGRYKGFQVVLTGDFNTTPDDTLYTILTEPNSYINRQQHNLSDEQITQLLPVKYVDSDSGELVECESADIRRYSQDSEQLAEKLEIAEKELEQDYKHIHDILEKYTKEYGGQGYWFDSMYGKYALYDPTYLQTQIRYPDGCYEPKYTNYTNWKGTLDYILVKRNTNEEREYDYKTEKILSLPSEKYLKPGLPNEQFGSDHMSLVGVIGVYKERKN